MDIFRFYYNDDGTSISGNRRWISLKSWIDKYTSSSRSRCLTPVSTHHIIWLQCNKKDNQLNEPCLGITSSSCLCWMYSDTISIGPNLPFVITPSSILTTHNGPLIKKIIISFSKNIIYKLQPLDSMGSEPPGIELKVPSGHLFSTHLWEGMACLLHFFVIV